MKMHAHKKSVTCLQSVDPSVQNQHNNGQIAFYGSTAVMMKKQSDPSTNSAISSTVQMDEAHRHAKSLPGDENLHAMETDMIDHSTTQGCCCSTTDHWQNSACVRFLTQSVWPGLGLLGESYMLFSMGILTPLWQTLFPECYNDSDVCSHVTHSMSYYVVLGVISGMIGIGYLGNIIGRRAGSITTAWLMGGGSWGMTLLTVWGGPNALGNIDAQIRLFRIFRCLLFIFGIGVGGEYPLAASSASEKAMAEMQKRANSNLNDDNVQQVARGRQVQLVFTMQGAGILLNSLVLMFLLGLLGDDGNTEHLLLIWQISYSIGAFILLIVVVTRILLLQESEIWKHEKLQREGQQLHGDRVEEHEVKSSIAAANNGRNSPQTHRPLDPMQPATAMVDSVSSLSTPPGNYKETDNHDGILRDYDDEIFDQSNNIWSNRNEYVLLAKNYGMRLLGVSLAWWLWDICFYGNKLFQSAFLLALTGADTTLFQFAAAASLNSAVALAGYLVAAVIVDDPRLGRRRLQQYGFLLTGCLFVGVGFMFENSETWILVVMYLGTSFLGQVGPNATTFLIPAEVFPTEMRTVCHGIAAASGKLGALTASIAFGSFDNELDMFMFSGYASFLACLVTLWFIPESTGLDLAENDRKWFLILQNRKSTYDGSANDPKFLSWYETNKLKAQHRQKSGYTAATDHLEN